MNYNRLRQLYALRESLGSQLASMFNAHKDGFGQPTPPNQNEEAKRYGKIADRFALNEIAIRDAKRQSSEEEFCEL